MDKIVVEGLGPPNAGKSTLMGHIASRLRYDGIPFLLLQNTDGSVKYLRSRALKIQEMMETMRLSGDEMTQLRNERSSLYQQILIEQDKKARRMRRGVVLIEHGLYGTVAMETGLGFKGSTLWSNLSSVLRPNLVIFLDVHPDELPVRGMSPLLKKGDFMQRVHGKMEAMYQCFYSPEKKNWIRLSGIEMENLDVTAASCVDRILDCLRAARVYSRSF